jgi:hypothetical protein
MLSSRPKAIRAQALLIAARMASSSVPAHAVRQALSPRNSMHTSQLTLRKVSEEKTM